MKTYIIRYETYRIAPDWKREIKTVEIEAHSKHVAINSLMDCKFLIWLQEKKTVPKEEIQAYIKQQPTY